MTPLEQGAWGFGSTRISKYAGLHVAGEAGPARPADHSVRVFQKLMGVEAFLAHHHAGDVGPPPAWGGIADDGPDGESSPHRAQSVC